jgi:hypothetical protein
MVDEQVPHRALALIAARPELFARQGFVVVRWRRSRGQEFGPYYELFYRAAGRQRSIYLGRAGPLVEQVRQALAALQTPLIQARACRRVRRQVRAALRRHKTRLSLLLTAAGLRLQGYQVRGWRRSSLLKVE